MPRKRRLPILGAICLIFKVANSGQAVGAAEEQPELGIA
jgi:hypothetical protein